jgi:hypothetical protein
MGIQEEEALQSVETQEETEILWLAIPKHR